MNALTPLPVLPAHAIPATEPHTRWLIDGLWGFDAVGILGGEPKCCKSLCALTMAVAVASGRDCLGGHRPQRTGTVLLFAAEDAPAIVRDRLTLLCAGMDIDLATTPIQMITAPRLRLDDATDRQRLELTIAQYRPVLLILDPFVRLHRVDENIAGEVAPILDSLRQLQRTYGCAIMVVHHARKGAGHIRSGQALRGSSEFHAWGDSNLFLRRQQSVLTLDIEHRAAPAPDPILLTLVASERHLMLQPTTEDMADDDAASPPDVRALAILADAPQPLTRREMQAHMKVRAATVGDVLDRLLAAGRIVRDAQGYRMPTTCSG
jgi:hypothetical protein